MQEALSKALSNRCVSICDFIKSSLRDGQVRLLRPGEHFLQDRTLMLVQVRGGGASSGKER